MYYTADTHILMPSKKNISTLLIEKCDIFKSPSFLHQKIIKIKSNKKCICMHRWLYTRYMCITHLNPIRRSSQINVRPDPVRMVLELFIYNMICYTCFVGLIQTFRIVRMLTGAGSREI